MSSLRRTAKLYRSSSRDDPQAHFEEIEPVPHTRRQSSLISQSGFVPLFEDNNNSMLEDRQARSSITSVSELSNFFVSKMQNIASGKGVVMSSPPPASKFRRDEDVGVRQSGNVVERTALLKQPSQNEFHVPIKNESYFSSEEIGISSIPDQIHRKVMRQGFQFNLLVCGQMGLGKKTAIDSLFMQSVAPERPNFEGEECPVNLEPYTKSSEIEEYGLRVKLRVTTFPGFGDKLDNSTDIEAIRRYVLDGFESYHQAETSLDRRNIDDTRSHVCLYFLPPWIKKLRPMDIKFVKGLQHWVNIILVVGRSDLLTVKEATRLKNVIRDDVTRHGLIIYDFQASPNNSNDSTEEEEDEGDAEYEKPLVAQKTRRLTNGPFCMVAAGPDQMVEVNGRRLRARVYPWGTVEVDNPRHSDFAKLRHLLISSNMQNLKDTTSEVLYERYRSTRLTEQPTTIITDLLQLPARIEDRKPSRVEAIRNSISSNSDQGSVTPTNERKAYTSDNRPTVPPKPTKAMNAFTTSDQLVSYF